MKETKRCKNCNKEVEPPHETKRGLCHLCNVQMKEKDKTTLKDFKEEALPLMV